MSRIGKLPVAIPKGVTVSNATGETANGRPYLRIKKSIGIGKAIRAVVMEISEYLACAMVDQGDCMAEYEAKESSRREKTKKAIKLD